MARIRSIKPEFWTSEQVMECSREARLFFIGLWNFCDDYGRHPAQAKKLRALIFPGDDDVSSSDVRRMIDELSTNGLVSIYAVDNIEYIEVCGWSHQKIDKKQSPKFPAPSDGIRRTVDELSPNDRRTIVERSTLDKEGKGREEDIPSPSEPGAAAPPVEPAYTDARHELYGEGKPILLSLGVSEKQCGAMITRWLRDTGDDCHGVLDAIRRARDERVMDPIPWITRALPTRTRNERVDARNTNRRPAQPSQFNAALARAVDRRTGGRVPPDDPGSVRPERSAAGDCDGDLLALGPPLVGR